MSKYTDSLTVGEKSYKYGIREDKEEFRNAKLELKLSVCICEMCIYFLCLLKGPQ